MEDVARKILYDILSYQQRSARVGRHSRRHIMQYEILIVAALDEYLLYVEHQRFGCRAVGDTRYDRTLIVVKF